LKVHPQDFEFNPHRSKGKPQRFESNPRRSKAHPPLRDGP
jgi:hypothetical protein